MAAPFPGMDPYLEAPDIWPDFHLRLACDIRGVLNQTLPVSYYARLDNRPEVGIVEGDQALRRIDLDEAVVRHPKPPTIASEPSRHAYVEIRDPSRGHHLVTLLEIVSPSNKQAGPDRAAYLRKQQEVLESDASLIELDLLRSGRRLLAYPEVEVALVGLAAPPDYVVLVNRAWRRGDRHPACQVFPVVVTEPLPCFPVPLRQGQAEIPLDLQYVFRRAYDSGPYRRGAVDYTAAPRPALSAELTAWAEECLRAAGLR